MKKVTKKQKTIISVVGVAIIAFGGTYAYGQSQSNKKLAEAKQELTVSTNKLVELDKQIIALLDSKDSNYLAKDVTQGEVDNLKEKVKKEINVFDVSNLSEKDTGSYEKEMKKTTTDMDKLESAMDTQENINGLYKLVDNKRAMNGIEVNTDLPIADELGKGQVTSVKKNYYKKEVTNSYEKTVNELIDNAESQINQLEKAKTEVAKVYKDGKVISTDTKAYDTAKAETDKVKNEKAKKDLSDQLAKVKADIDKKAKEEAEKNNQSSDAKEASQADGAKQDNATEKSTTDGTATATAGNNATADNGYTANGGATDNGNAGSNGGGYTPPTGNGGGATGGGSANTPSGNGGGGSAPSTTYDPMTPIGEGGLFGSQNEANSAGLAKALELKKQDGVTRQVVVWEVKYTDGRNAGWTYSLA